MRKGGVHLEVTADEELTRHDCGVVWGLFGVVLGIESELEYSRVECSSKGQGGCCLLLSDFPPHPTKTREAGAMSSPNVGLVDTGNRRRRRRSDHPRSHVPE